MSNDINRLLPAPSAHSTIEAIVADAKRAEVPIRLEFLQQPQEDGSPGPGPLAEFMRAGDRRGLVLWMLVLTKASGDDFSVTLASTVWARAMGFDLPDSKSARTAISKAWTRLERRSLSRGRGHTETHASRFCAKMVQGIHMNIRLGRRGSAI